MTLANRLSAFFLISLAAVLLIFSMSLYGLAWVYLYRQLDVRLDATLDALEAAVDVEPGGMEWEPDERLILLGIDPGDDQVRWAVQDGEGNLVDSSTNAPDRDFPPQGVMPFVLHDQKDATSFFNLPGWRLAVRHLRLEELLQAGRGHPEDDDPDDDVEHAELIIVAGSSPAPVWTVLGRLALSLLVISVVVLSVCTAVGQRLIQHGLLPVRRMARSARVLNPSEPGWGLPEPGTHDELDELARSFNDLLGRLRDAYDRQRDFAGDASHQLRTPLTALLSQVDLALRRERPAEEYRRFLRTVRDEGQRLREIIEGLLFLVRSEADVDLATLSEIDLNRWLSDHLQRWADHPRADDLTVGRLDPTGMRVRVHPGLLSQAVDNLIENAFKYSDPGEPVIVELLREGDVATLAVEDRGCGLEPETAALIFEPFYRAESSRRCGRPGVGLGLAVASRIARLFRGSLSVNSQMGRGSRFELSLPVVPALVPRSL